MSPSSSPGSTRCSTSATVILAGRRHHRVEIARGLAVDKVALGIALPGVHERKVGDQAGFHDVRSPLKISLFLALGDLGADAGLGEERGDAGTTGAHTLGQCALRVEFDLEVASEKLLGEQFVLANVRRDHLLDLPRLEQQAEPRAVNAGIVRHAGEVFHAGIAERRDQIALACRTGRSRRPSPSCRPCRRPRAPIWRRDKPFS